MIALHALLALVLSAAPIDVVLSRSIDTTPERADDLLGRVVGALTQAGVAVRPADATKQALPAGTVSAACVARRACVRDLGVALGARAIIGVDVGHVTGQMAVTLEAIAVADGLRLAQHSFTLDSAGYPAGIDANLKVFVGAVSAALPKPEDAPVAVTLAPAPVAPRPVVVAVVPSRPVGPVVLGATAVVATAVAIGLGAMGASTAEQLERAKTTYGGAPSSLLSRAQAEQVAAAANGQLAGAGVAGGAAAAIGATALLWWVLTR